MKSTKIKQLKEKNPQAQIDVVKLIRLLDPTSTGILTDMMLRHIIAKDFREEPFIPRRVRSYISLLRGKDLVAVGRSRLMSMMLEYIYDTLGEETLCALQRFNSYRKQHQIVGDINVYKTLEEIKDAVFVTDLRIEEKSNTLKKHKVFEDDVWLVLLPLSLAASRVYGAATKWCTTQRDNDHAFWNYTSGGFVFYIINKKTNVKYAYHRRNITSDSEDEPGGVLSEFFNAADMRIDSIDAEIPHTVISTIQTFVKECYANGCHTNSNMANYDYEGLRTFRNEGNKLVSEAQPLQPTVVGANVLGDTIDYEEVD